MPLQRQQKCPKRPQRPDTDRACGGAPKTDDDSQIPRDGDGDEEWSSCQHGKRARFGKSVVHEILLSVYPTCVSLKQYLAAVCPGAATFPGPDRSSGFFGGGFFWPLCSLCIWCVYGSRCVGECG